MVHLHPGKVLLSFVVSVIHRPSFMPPKYEWGCVIPFPLPLLDFFGPPLFTLLCDPWADFSHLAWFCKIHAIYANPGPLGWSKEIALGTPGLPLGM